VALTAALALIVGAILIAGGIARLGFISDFLSKSVVTGFVFGLAITIIVGQLPKLFGFSTDADSFVGEVAAWLQGIANGEVVGAALGIGLLSLAVILVLGRLLPKVPAVLAAVVIAMAVSVAAGLADRGVKVIGPLPEGLPEFTIPAISLPDLGLLLAGAMGIALVALADTISTATSFADRLGDEVDGDREMIGIGAANVAAGFFQGFPVSTSGSRTAVAEQAGAKTQLTGLVGAGMIALMLVAFPTLLAELPQPTLAAIVIAAAMSLADIPAVRRLFRQRPTDAWLSIAAFLAVVFFGVLPGILTAIALSVVNVFRRVWRPYRTELGRVEGIPGLHDVTMYPQAQVMEQCPVYRFDAPLIFANASTFRDEIRRLAAAEPRPHWIVVAAEPITDVDTTACDMLDDLVPDLDQAGTRLVFAELKDPVRAKLRAYGLPDVLGDERFYPTLGSAVKAYRAQFPGGRDQAEV
jgi:high affinity sulfate transporter 1